MESAGGMELLPAPEGAPEEAALARTSRRRVRVFLLTFILCLAVGLAWDLQRPALYRASASLLTVAPPEVDQQNVEADIQHVTIQKQRLLGRPLLERVARELATKNPGAELPGVDEIRAMLDVSILPETNLVELQAQGGDPALLSLLVNTWIESYLKLREEEVAALNARTVDVLREQYEALGKKIAEKRAALNDFRENNQILSTERDENQILSRLKGLNESLNTVNEEMVKARARLDAVEAAIARGETVVPEQDKRAYAQMVQRAQELREQVAEMNRRYTKQYIERSASLKVIPEKLAKLEAKILKSQRSGQDYVLTSARQDYAAARQTVESLRKQLEDFKAEASEFTARFSEYQAMQEDLAGLELLYRELEDRLVKVEVTNRAKYPQLQVVEWAYPPEKPIWPHYWRDAGIVAGVSLAVALLMVWLVNFLKPIARGTGRAGLGITIYPANAALEQQGQAVAPALGKNSQQALPGTGIAELGVDRIARLLENADPFARQLIALLMSGLSAEEILRLEPSHIDLEKGEVAVPGDPPRKVGLAPGVVDWFEREGSPWLAWSGKDHFDREEIDARLQLAAVDAGLAESGQIDAELLRNTYLLYLVRQGIRLSELETIVGTMPARELLDLGRYSPAHAGKPASEVQLAYPLMA